METIQQRGILLHISSLPSKYGIGSFGKAAFEFIDKLKEGGFTYWQMLPLGMTSYGDSPYQCLSAFAGNPYFVDIDLLVKDGLLKKDEAPIFEGDKVDYGFLWETRFKLLKLAYDRFKPDNDFYDWVGQTFWLDDFTAYMSAKTINNFSSWSDWPDEYKFKDRLKESFFTENKQIIGFWQFVQYKFYKQLAGLKRYAASAGIKLIGDLPIYVAMDSADVWANLELFLLDKNLKPTEVAGVPPDLFSADGQLWGNPLYDLKRHEDSGFIWWIKRLTHILSIFDIVRIDHFRAFESYYKIPSNALSAKQGYWEKGFGLKIFEAMPEKLGGRIIAEDLGVITNEVRDLLKKSGFPGMKVLQFGFETDKTNEYLPDNYKNDNCVVYTGTHDNDTTNGWYKGLDDKARGLFDEITNKKPTETAASAMIRLAFLSRAKIAIAPMQDILDEDTDCRMNFPSKAGYWRYKLDKIPQDLTQKTVIMTQI